MATETEKINKLTDKLCKIEDKIVEIKTTSKIIEIWIKEHDTEIIPTAKMLENKIAKVNKIFET